jgi:plastocyanin
MAPAAASAAGPQTFHVSVGAQGIDEAIQGNVFLNNNISVNVGDTVTWTIKSGEPHTVTFGAAFGSISPFAPGNVTPGQTISPNQVVNTGLLCLVVSAGCAPVGSFSATFSAPGVYPYLCLLHPGMAGTVTVSAANSPYPHQQAFYDQQSTRESLAILGQGLDLFGTGLATALRLGPTNVTAGIGAPLPASFEGNVWVARFEPRLRVIHKGETVTWTNMDSSTPHTISIGPDPSDPFAPTGGTTVTTAPGATTVNSGLIGAPLFGPAWYSLKFEHTGTYDYFCALHDDLGMKGTIVVVP